MNNVPETARIVRIQHDPASKTPVLREGGSTRPSASGAPASPGPVTARGEAAIRARLQTLNCAARTSSGPLSPQPSAGFPPPAPDALDVAAPALTDADDPAAALEPLPSAPSLTAPSLTAGSLLHIAAPIVALEGYGGGAGRVGRLALVDTPGPNEAGEEQLRAQVGRGAASELASRGGLASELCG